MKGVKVGLLLMLKVTISSRLSWSIMRGSNIMLNPLVIVAGVSDVDDPTEAVVVVELEAI